MISLIFILSNITEAQLFTRGSYNFAHFMQQNPNSEKGAECHRSDHGFEMKGVILTPCPEGECLPEDGRSVPVGSSRHYRKRKEYFSITMGSEEPRGT